MGTYYGIARFDGLKFTTFDASTKGIPPGPCYKLLPSQDGSLFCKVAQEIVHYESGKFSTLEFQNDGYERIHPLSVTPNGTLFCVGSNKDRSMETLFEIDQSGNQSTTIAPLPKSTGSMRFRMAWDQQGQIWFGSFNGIHRVSKAQLEHFLTDKSKPLSARSYGLSDGLSTLQCTSGHPASLRMSDGRLWFATIEGINIVDPTKIPINPSPPELVDFLPVLPIFHPSELVSESL